MSARKQYSVAYGLRNTCACTNHAHLPGVLPASPSHVSGVLTRACYLADKRATDAMQLVLLE